MNRMKAFMVVAAATVAFIAVVSTFDTADAARRCKSGYVWRDAADGDGACVTPEERDVAKAQNQNAENNRQKGGGAYGPKTCRQGYVWREAFAGDKQIETFVADYNHHRYHESIDNLTPADVYFGRGQTILLQRERIKRQTIAQRRLQYQRQAA